ncbi:MAG: formate dehydrogenase accessory sulfurtransferase FdhD [Desulfobacterales bacterium]|nr:formate dehydrogenase accessory sulfurtransferase FdhD [Desulfobacterales bacterium]
MEKYIPYTVEEYKTDKITEVVHNLICEEPLSIMVQGKPYSVVMRTPGDEIPHAAGFCLGEGIIDKYGDISSIAICEGSDSNVVAVTLKQDRLKNISAILERKGFVSQTSCGICGKEIIEDIKQSVIPLESKFKIHPDKLIKCLTQFYEHQNLRNNTRSAHGAALFNLNDELLSIAEDVGRHNAVDKAIGKLLIQENIYDASILILSSRISFELVQKAARAKIPLILAISRPTALAIKLADDVNMTILTLLKEPGFCIYTGKDRINIFSPSGRNSDDIVEQASH